MRMLRAMISCLQAAEMFTWDGREQAVRILLFQLGLLLNDASSTSHLVNQTRDSYGAYFTVSVESTVLLKNKEIY